MSKTVCQNRYGKILLFWILIAGFSSFASAQTTDSSLLNIDRIFDSDDFNAQYVGGFRWLKSGDAYTKIEPSAGGKGGTDLVSYDVEKKHAKCFNSR